MEGKDGVKNPRTRIMTLLTENVEREVAEESRIKVLQGLRHTGMVFENVEKNYPPNTFFQYHIFQALVSPKEWMRASAELEWCREHPAAFSRMKRDKREKDMIQWYSPSETRIMGRWSAQIVAMYLKNFA
jgi:ADP-ribose pyrophosphatase YjhB (NUDIX family)